MQAIVRRAKQSAMIAQAGSMSVVNFLGTSGMSIAAGIEGSQPGKSSVSSVESVWEKDDHTKCRDCRCKSDSNVPE